MYVPQYSKSGGWLPKRGRRKPPLVHYDRDYRFPAHRDGPVISHKPAKPEQN